MKNITQIFASAMFAAVVGFGCVGYAQEDHPGYATVVRVQGIASYNLGDGNWHPLVPGKKLVAGSTIRTGQDGVVDVVLGKKIAFPQGSGYPSRITQATDAAVRGLISDAPSAQQNAIRLNPNAVLSIDKLTVNDTGADTVSDTELNLQKGRMFGTVKKLTAASQYIVKIPNGIAGIRGTEYTLDADDDTAACYSSESGGLTLVLYVNGATVTFNIAPGEMVGPGTISSGTAQGPTVPVTPNIESLLANVFSALNTTYGVVVNYDFSNNNLYISSITGTKP